MPVAPCTACNRKFLPEIRMTHELFIGLFNMYFFATERN